MDETYVWEHAAAQWSWCAPGKYRSPLRVKSSKGKRWSCIHAGWEEGWLYGAEFLEVGDKNGEFHGTITAEIFQEWAQNGFFHQCRNGRVILLWTMLHFIVKWQ
jgi:hypothetical protein